jgi:Uma2 family endonuclease
MTVVDAMADDAVFTQEDLPRLRYGSGRYELLGGALVVTHGEFSSDSLADLPDDGFRHELITGTLIVTPAPGFRHQQVSLGLASLLRTHVPAEMVVLQAPFDVRLDAETTVQPDVLVARRGDVTARNLPVPPLLAVEILSRATRHLDLGSKKDLYGDAGCLHYWVIDPHALRLTAWDLWDGNYVEVADISGKETWTAESPFPVTITPADLVR